jgi:CDGSH-type Zn-finger protein
MKFCYYSTTEKTDKAAKVAQTFPYAVSVEAGKKYSWCECGHSSRQPFCDGTHKKINEKTGSQFKPVRYTATEDEEVFFCGCKQTSTAPLCNGNHMKFKKLQSD